MFEIDYPGTTSEVFWTGTQTIDLRLGKTQKVAQASDALVFLAIEFDVFLSLSSSSIVISIQLYYSTYPTHAYLKNNCLCLGSTPRGRPLFFSTPRGFLASGSGIDGPSA